MARTVVYCSSVNGPSKPSLAQAILTDVHLWVPVIVLSLGIGLLFLLH